VRRIRRFALIALLAAGASNAQDLTQVAFKRLTIEELMDVDVTSVSRNVERLGRTAAAVTVITAEDIRRSGATSIPEVLRLVPGLQVARFNAGSWPISARGFNSAAANKLLVLIDGRTVYSPLFSGTFWEVQDLVLEDIARIEVVRGPGATLWGANAVNGIISIVTKTAHQTQDSYATFGGGGADDLAFGSFRTGGTAGRDISYRFFGKYRYNDQMALASGADAKDSLRIGRAGYRVDGSIGPNELTVQGDAYRGLAGILTRDDAKVLGGDILARWTRTISNTSSLQIQSYYARDLRRVPLQSDFRQRIFDIDLQHNFAIQNHEITWGAEYRWNSDTTFRTPVLSFVPDNRSYPLETAFAQDEIALAANRVKLQLGSKFEHNDFTGFEFQPSVRTSWAIRPEHFLWGAVSRAIHPPTRFDSDIRFGPPAAQFIGNPDLGPEELIAFEVGYRSQAVRRLTVDIATYYNRYDRIRSLELQPAAGGILILNNLNARTRGAEINATYDLGERLRFTAGYSFLAERLTPEPGHVDIFNGTIEGNDPRHQFFVRGSADLPHGFEVDSTLRFTGRLPAPAVPSYTELDARLGWATTGELELAIVGRNLLHRRHPEFGPPSPNREELERNVYGRIALRF